MTSLLTIALSIMAFDQADRNANPSKPNVAPIGSVVEFCWRFFVVAARVLSIALFATQFKFELFIFLGLHWLLMASWIFMIVSFQKKIRG